VSGDVRFLPIFMDAVSDLRECDAVYLNDVRADGIFLLSEYGDLGKEKGFFMFFLQDHMNYAIDLSAGKDEYMKSISRKLRKDLRSKRKHAINNYGPMRLKKINGREEIEKYFELYLKFSGQAFVSRNKTSIFSDGEIATFFREFLVSMDRKDRLTAHVFFGGDTVMAISFAYRFGRGFKWILTGFNYDCKDVRPGYLFIEELISEMCNMGETHCNCYGHATFYKKQWCNRQEPLYRVFLVKKTARGMVYRNLKYAASALKSKEILVKVK
jgi:CelD/BcsL family acetyltransferase involved in cellulose biosynthesis